MAMDRNLEILSNNLANVSTPGFKANRPVFQAVLAKQVAAVAPGEVAPPPTGERQDVIIAEIGVDMTQGSLVHTGNDLDIAISGDGVIGVETAGGVRYTRRGTMQLDANRRLTVGGVPIRAEGGGDIVIPPESYIVVDPNGGVYANEEFIAQMEFVQFADPQALVPVGGGFLQANGAAQPAEGAEVLQGYLEDSNVNPIWGMTELIRTTRMFETAEKVISAFKQMDDKLAREIGRV
jgi:flagellar basal body rod protein FlgG